MKKINYIIFLSFIPLLLIVSCKNRQADKIFHNGKVYLVDNNFSMVDAFAIRNGRILEAGSDEDIMAEYDGTEVIDLNGATVFPGFIDAHCHFYGYATDLMKCDLYGSTSFEDVVFRLEEYSKLNTFGWILGRGWDQNDWSDKSFPNNHILDSLFPDKPVFVMRIDGHMALCNSQALALAGVNEKTNVNGGEVLVENGKVTGMLLDNAVDLVKSKIPPFSEDLIEKAILKAQENCFAVGLTTLDDAGLGKDSIFQLMNLQKSGKLKMRIYAMISEDPASLEYFYKNGPYKDERMTINAIKVYADGALGSRGACLKREYSDMKGHFGYILRTEEYLNDIADKAHHHGFQLCTHAIGDSANDVVIKLYSEHLSTENRRRWRIEHCQVVNPKDRKDLSNYSIIPSVQPTHATSDMYWAEERLGRERIKTAYAYEDLRDAAEGIIIFGTDFPVEKINPVYTFYAAVARKDLNGYPKNGFLSENKVKRKDAIRAMTIHAAFANFEDEEKGSLEDGKYADFVILDQDLMTIEEDEIPATKVLATYLNGERVFKLND